jgi:hypothetical protein
MVSNKYCRDCVYFGGASEHVCSCNYIFIEHQMRPCPPDKGCTVKKKRARKRRMKEDRTNGKENR